MPAAFVLDRDGTTRSATNDVGAYDGGEASTDNAYFESLVANSAHFGSHALRSTQSIDNATVNRSGEWIYYDATEDAAAIPIGPSGSIQYEARLDAGNKNTGTVFAYLECKWDERWDANIGDTGAINTHKAFMIRKVDSEIWLEVRCQYGDAEGEGGQVLGIPGEAGFADLREYGLNNVVVQNEQTIPYGNNYGSGTHVFPLINHYIWSIEAWNYLFYFLDYDNDDLAIWVGDENRAPVYLYDLPNIGFGGRAADFFSFHLNSSQTPGWGTPYPIIWGRNMAVLHDLTRAEAEALVAQR